MDVKKLLNLLRFAAIRRLLSFIVDKRLLNFLSLVPLRKNVLNDSSSIMPDMATPINELAKRLHPKRQYFVISEITDEADGVRTFKLVPDKEKGTKQPAYFRAGQYLSLKARVGNTEITRPYSLSSAPADATKGFYTLTIKKSDGGFLTSEIFKEWKVGGKVVTSGPEGQFYYERLRDKNHLVGIAGGSGITSFLSMLRQFNAVGYPVDFTLFYGCNKKEDIIRYDELQELQKRSGGKLKVVFVMVDDSGVEGAEKGLVSAETVKKHVNPADCSFFICGPQAMYEFVSKELGKFALPKKQIRAEMFGEIKGITSNVEYPKGVKDSFSLTVTMGGKTATVPTLSKESLLVAMERAGLKPPSKCRSSVCAFCRCELVSGKVFIPKEEDYRRGADKKFSFIHACMSFPLSNVKIIIPCDEA